MSNFGWDYPAGVTSNAIDQLSEDEDEGHDDHSITYYASQREDLKASASPELQAYIDMLEQIALAASTLYMNTEYNPRSIAEHNELHFGLQSVDFMRGKE